MARIVSNQIAHDGMIVEAETAKSNKLDTLIRDLFSQYGWNFSEISRDGSHRNIKLDSPTGDTYDINLFIGNIRGESRNPNEKKIQLGENDPRQYKDEITIILGIYVFNESDSLNDVLFVGYPIDENVNYQTNASIRGVRTNEILWKAKNNGVCVDKAKRLVGFRPEFIFFYLANYKDFHEYEDNNYYSNELDNLDAQFVCDTDFSRNRIVFGAPGTGKSFVLEEDRKKLLGKNNITDYERVTFHPDYSYANFVGTYKPVPFNDNGEDKITYKFSPGPFMRVYVKAQKNINTACVKPFLLIIEEINRANVAAVFGDIFQLLDRAEDESSEYSIHVSEDIKRYLADELNGVEDDYEKIRIPSNMFIWATMNSADQGVFPMDTAFKRRWDFTYIGIDDNEAELIDKTVKLGKSHDHKVEWNSLRKAINDFLAESSINEDKQLGPYFISKKILVPKSGTEIDSDEFIEIFKNKVIMYLFEDAAKLKRKELFQGCIGSNKRFSEICKQFDLYGVQIFHTDIVNKLKIEDIPVVNSVIETILLEDGSE